MLRKRSQLGAQGGRPLPHNPESIEGYGFRIRSLCSRRSVIGNAGWCYPRVQAIIVAIDQYAEAATGNRNYFLNRPQRIC